MNVRRKLGCLGGLLIIGWLVLAAVTIVRGCNGPQMRGKRLLRTDPCAAAALFAEDVRGDWKGSMQSLIALSEIEQPCALYQMIKLMDLPEGRQTNQGFRRFIFE